MLLSEGILTSNMASTCGLEYVRCNLCEADDGELLFRHPVRPHQIGKYAMDEWDIFRCRQCGLIYENPRPDKVALESFYQFNDSEDYDFAQNWFIESSELQRGNWNRYLKIIMSYSQSGRLLDIGSGGGSFLVEARRAGFEVFGQDISPFFIEHCQARLGLTIHAGELEDLGLPSSSFDCVTSFDVIEHHPYPKQLVREVNRLLKPGGLFVVGTHNVGSFFARIYGPRWRYMLSIAHLTFFDRETITKLLNQEGFRVVRFGGSHTIDHNRIAELKNWFVQTFKLVVLRGLILGIYKPAAHKSQFLQSWKISWNGKNMNHSQLLGRTGMQVAMNDNFLCLAVKEK